MSDLLRRFSYPLAYIFLVSLCVIGMVSGAGPSELGLGSRLVLAVTVPLRNLVTLPVRESRRVWNDYIALIDVREENEDLLGRISKLEEENLQYKEAIVSSERFRQLAGFQAQREVPMVPANVMAEDLSPYFKTVIIDQGSSAGVEPGMAVITERGVVGVVSGTTPSAAKVMLVIDPQSRVDAFVQRTRARGTVRGTSQPSCKLDYLLREEDVQDGDLVLTSGLGGIYPKGLVLGHTAKVQTEPYGLFKRANVEPIVDFRKLEEVFVLLERRELPPEEAFSTNHEDLWPEVPE